MQILSPDTRWDFLGLGPGSANKSGAFLALALVASTWFAVALRRGWVVMLALAVPLGLGLFATGSRGGFLAAAAGLGATVWAAGWPGREWLRRLPGRGRLALGAAAVLAAVAFFAWGPGTRFAAAVAGRDPSIGIRAEMYGAGLRMLADAPGGWGAGQSSEVFRHWYQQPGGALHFLSLVNSHLTWMTERGWGFRAAYAAGWGIVLGLLWPRKAGEREPGGAVAFGLWVCMGVGACFSSTLTWPWMWALPVGFLGAWVLRRGLSGGIPWRRAVAGGGAGLVALAALHGVGAALPRELPLAGGPEGLVAGAGERDVLLVGPEEGVLGDFFGQSVRAALPADRAVAVRWAEETAGLRAGAGSTVVFAGGLPVRLGDGLPGGRWLLLNPEPRLPEDWSAAIRGREVRVVLGSEVDWRSRFFWEDVAAENAAVRVETAGGRGLFLAGWESWLWPEAEGPER